MNKSTIRRLAIQQEANVRECRVCKEKKLRILAGKYPSMNNKYVDETGDLWSGKTCPSCNKARIREKMKSIRDGRKVRISQDEANIIIADQEIKK